MDSTLEPELLEHAEVIIAYLGRGGSLTCGEARRVLALVAERLTEIEGRAKL